MPLKQSNSRNPFLFTYIQVNICQLRFLKNHVFILKSRIGVKNYIFQSLLNINPLPQVLENSAPILLRVEKGLVLCFSFRVLGTTFKYKAKLCATWHWFFYPSQPSTEVRIGLN